jgi:diguanylate cyclase (GGDEF)-like protein
MRDSAECDRDERAEWHSGAGRQLDDSHSNSVGTLIGQLRRSLSRIIHSFASRRLLGRGLVQRVAGQIFQTIYGLTTPALALDLGKLVTVPSLRLREAEEMRQALARASRMLLEAQHKALHDPLTGLPNRELFVEVANQQLVVCRSQGLKLAVLYIDLDGFKSVNDSYGHAVGDELLCAVATRLRNATRGADLAARLGGDEFAILLVNTRLAAAEKVARKLASLLSQPYAISGLTQQISASIGASEYPSSGTSIAALMERADAAMYKSKAARAPSARTIS